MPRRIHDLDKSEVAERKVLKPRVPEDTKRFTDEVVGYLNPVELKILVAWTMAKDLDEALRTVGISRRAYNAMPEERREMLERLVSEALASTLLAARALLQAASLKAVQTMTELMDSANGELAFRAAKEVMHMGLGRPVQHKSTRVGGTINVKGYATEAASPDVWDTPADTIEAELLALTDGHPINSDI